MSDKMLPAPGSSSDAPIIRITLVPVAEATAELEWRLLQFYQVLGLD